jgi:hypothetical protein
MRIAQNSCLWHALDCNGSYVSDIDIEIKYSLIARHFQSRTILFGAMGINHLLKCSIFCCSDVWIAVWWESCPTSITSSNGTLILCLNCPFCGGYLPLSILNFSLIRGNKIICKRQNNFNMKCVQMLCITSISEGVYKFNILFYKVKLNRYIRFFTYLIYVANLLQC